MERSHPLLSAALLSQANDVFAVTDKVGFGQISNNYEVDGRLFLERWWFKNA